MENFTPISGLIGGAIIGLSAGLFFLFNGRIAGISGILGGLLSPAPGDIWWRVAFLGGLILGPIAVMLANPTLASPHITASLPVLVIGGLIVGYGTRMGGGCTSGHGVCGIARLSPRSILATVSFMAAGAAVVFLTRHVFGG